MYLGSNHICIPATGWSQKPCLSRTLCCSGHRVVQRCHMLCQGVSEIPFLGRHVEKRYVRRPLSSGSALCQSKHRNGGKPFLGFRRDTEGNQVDHRSSGDNLSSSCLPRPLSKMPSDPSRTCRSQNPQPSLVPQALEWFVGPRGRSKDLLANLRFRSQRIGDTR